MRVEGVGDVVSRSVNHFGRYAIVELQVHGLAGQWQALEPIAEQMVRSFRLTAAAAYDESPAAKPSKKGRDSLALGLVSLGIIVLLAAAHRQRQRAKSQTIPPPSE